MRSINVRPLGDNVVVLPLPASEVQGAYLVQARSDQYQVEGTVVACGPGIRNPLNPAERLALSVRVGDRVVYGKFQAADFTFDGESYVIMPEAAIKVVCPG